MFSILLRLKRKIKKLLKVQTGDRQQVQTSLHSRTFKFLMLLLFSVLVGVFYQAEALYDPLDMPRKGEIALETVLAPFKITVYKTDKELRDDQDEARLQIPFYIDYDTTIANSAINNLKRFIDQAQLIRQKPIDDSLKINQLSDQFPLLSRNTIVQTLKKDSLAKVFRILDEIYRKNIYAIGVLPDNYSLPESKFKNVIIHRGESQSLHHRENLYTLTMANTRLLTALNNIKANNSIEDEYYYPVGRAFLQPNLRVNNQEYNKQIGEALASISPIKEIIEQNDIIVRDGQKVSERQERILNELVRHKRDEAEQEGWLLNFMPMFARIILIFAAFSMLYLFMFFFRKDIYRSNPKLLALFLVFVLQLFVVHLQAVQAELSVYLYLIALLPIVITILFDAEVGIISTIVLAVILGILHRFDFTLALMIIVVGSTACFASRQVRKRSEFFRITYRVAAAYAVFIFLVETLKLTPNADILTEVGFGLINGVVTSIIAMWTLPIFESIFGITTDVTLLELSDLNHPLLKRLALEAPGTYHHSIIVGTLTEAATKAIGGNSLLARVGAYFHDIGKIEIPEYFVENQMGIKSKHNELTPSMSSIILSSHVKKGRILGEDADIPDAVLNFIEEHHGTMVQSYFYNKAKEQGLDDINMDKFRYPGPKPQIRETGIAMLADAVEAASRTLDDPKPARINNLIQRIINDRFESGELDECPLTLKDLAKIKESFSQILIGIFHQRIAYPKKEGEAE